MTSTGSDPNRNAQNQSAMRERQAEAKRVDRANASRNQRSV
jgi:hypothetical protein